MSDIVEYGKCDICGDMSELTRKYYEYPIKCECHSPNHFEVVSYCNSCKPEEPEVTTITFNTEKLKKLLNDDTNIENFLERKWQHMSPDVWKKEIEYDKRLIKNYLTWIKTKIL